MLRVALRPRWIAALLLTLAFASGFVLLSQWQIGRSIEQATVVHRDTEHAVALGAVAEPQSGVTTVADEQRVTAHVTFVDGDFSVLSGRINHGKTGYWLVGHAVTDDGVSLAVALGWASTEDAATAASHDFPTEATIDGRYLASEPAGDDDLESGRRTSMAVATLINEWMAPGPVYGGFVILTDAPDGLTAIDSPPPATTVELNWLNVFYAVEWVVFAGFAIFLWWRFVRDAWEREEQERAHLN